MHHDVLSTFVVVALYCVFKEKWAKCYRHFDHGDTDTNKYLER